MTWSPTLFGPGDTFTYQQANTLLGGPYYLLSAGVDQTIPDGVATPIEFDAVTEYNSIYSSASTPATSLVVPIEGTYLIVAQATFHEAATGVREAYLTVGGVEVGGVSQVASTTRSWVAQVSATKKLSTAAEIALCVYQDSGDDLDTSAATYGGCMLSVAWTGLR